MRKLLAGMVAAVIALCALPGASAAPQYSSRGSILVESDVKNDSNTKKATVRGSAKADITKLFIWTAVNSSRVSEKSIVITSDTGRVEEGTKHPYIPVDMRLRVTNPDAKKKVKYIVGETDTTNDKEEKAEDDDKISVFEYFTLTVKDGDEVLFTADDIPADTTEVEIPLRLFNCKEEDSTSGRNYSDEDKYTISLRESSSLEKSDVTEFAAPTKWKWYVDATQLSYMVDGKPTPTPRATPTPKPTPTPKAAPTPKASAAPESDTEKLTPAPEKNDVKLKAGDYLVGKDIDEGRYYVVGDGMLKTYDIDGNMTGNVDLTTAKDTNGYYSVNLKNDETFSLSDDAEFKITVPASGEEATVTPTPRVRTTPTPRVRTTSTPRVRTTPTPKANTTPKATAKTSPKPGATPKPNPKTGDTVPIMGLAVLGLAALSVVAVIQVKKKKSN